MENSTKIIGRWYDKPYLEQSGRHAEHVGYEITYYKKSRRGEQGAYLLAHEATLEMVDNRALSMKTTLFQDVSRVVFVKGMSRNNKKIIAQLQETLEENIEAVHEAFTDYENENALLEVLGVIYG